MITINYIPHTRDFFHPLTFYYLNKIKKENKEKVELNVLIGKIEGVETSTEKWLDNIKKLEGIKVNVVNNLNSYMEKLNYGITNGGEYSVKLDEDCFINNYLWDFLIENTSILEDENNLVLAPVLSNGIPTAEYFIEGFFDKDIVDEIYSKVVESAFPQIWGFNYPAFLNKHTLGSEKWDSDAFYKASNEIPYHYKGIHPFRINADSQSLLNAKILENLDTFTLKQDYKTTSVKNRYFCNSFFMIKTDTWKTIVNDNTLFVDPFDEVPLNRYATQNNKKLVFVKNGFGIHTMYNTLYSFWRNTDNRQKSYDFYRELENKLIS